MSSFEEWLRQNTQEVAKILNSTPDGKVLGECYDKHNYVNWPLSLLDYNEEDTEVKDLVYPCKGCGDLVDIVCEPEDFDELYHYCGKNRWCCP